MDRLRLIRSFRFLTLIVLMALGTAESASTPPLQVTAMIPAPGSTVTSRPATVTVTLNRAVDPSTVSTETCRLTRPGPDGLFDTADDIAIRPTSVSVTGSNRIKIDLADAPLSNDVYRVRLLGNAPTVTGDFAHYKFDEGTGTTAADSSGHHHNGVVGGALWTSGVLGKALQFNTGTDNVTINVTDVPIPWTACMWVNRQPSPDVSAILINGGTAALKLEQYPNTGLVGFTAYGAADFTFGYSAPIGTWTHLTFVGNTGGTALYVNGNYAETNPNMISMPLSILGNSAGDAMRGSLDDVRVFNRELTPEQIHAIGSFKGAVTDTNGNLLDGEYTGTLPSGNGTPGGDFVAKFTVNVPPPAPPRATSMTPSPGSTLTAPPSAVVVAFNKAISSASVSVETCRLVRAGADGILGTADDVAITPQSVTVTGTNNVRLALGGVSLPNDLYQVTLSGALVGAAGLVANWRFDEASGTKASDTSGNGYVGTLQGPTWFAPGKVGPACLNYNGMNTSVAVDAPAIAPPWTAALWVKRQDSPNPDARLMDSPGFPEGCSLRLEQFGSNRQVGVTRYGAFDAAFNYTTTTDTWTHLTFVGTDSGTSLYANGVLVETIPYNIELPMAHIGSQGDHAMLGLLDEVRVYNRNLTDAEIRTLATAPSAVTGNDGVVIDGEFSGAFPSGNGVSGGDFVATFRVRRR
jgi:hypothetical protein